MSEEIRVDSVNLWTDGPDVEHAAAVWLDTADHARWLGGPSSLGTFGLHDDNGYPEERHVARALAGRHVFADGVQVRVPASGDGMFVAIDVPEWVSRSRLAVALSARAEIDDAILDGLDAAIEHVRRSTRLAGRREFAYGVAALGVLRVEHDLHDERLCVEAVVFGVEREDGSLVTMDPLAQVSAGVRAEAGRVARATLIHELRALGYVERPIERRAWIGRGRAWVPDPLDEYRHLLGERAEVFNDEAILKGEQVAEYDDHMLERRRNDLSVAFDGLDRESLANDEEWEPWAQRKARQWLRAQEDVVALESRIRGGDVSPNLARAAEAMNERIATLQIAQPLEPALEELTSGRELTHDSWVQAVEFVAVLREQAVRQERKLGRERDAPVGATAIGAGELAEVLERRRNQAHRLRELAQHPDAARVIGRADVVAPKALDRLRHVIGERRADALAPHVEALTGWLADQPREWVVDRQAELGDPMKQLNGRALTQWRLNAAAQGRLIRLLSTAQAHDVSRHQQELHRLQTQAEILRAQGHDIGELLQRDGDHLARAIAYTDELALRREMEIAQSAERAVVDPPAHVHALIGPAPEPAAPERQEWEALARATEAAHAGARADLEAGTDRHAMSPEEARQLDERVDALRADRGMEPRAVELQRGLGPGLDGP